MQDIIGKEIKAISTAIIDDYDKGRHIDKLDVFNQPDTKVIYELIHELTRVAFPGYVKDNNYRIYDIRQNMAMVIEDIAFRLNKQIAIAMRYGMKLDEETLAATREESQRITLEFLRRIPQIREFLATDVEALFDGDPAAESADEIIFAYPGLYAVAIFRFAHELYKLNVPVIPRIMTELAHSKTGIDINPGATIGKYFMIDHGTGIVIGETTQIGEHVKLYQGVTLGALSTSGGRKLFNKKRHPTIEDYVTIYSGASILGGDTVIGRGSLIGGNVFLTHSVPPETRVSVKNQELRYKHGSEEI
ncbi:MAG: serine acetyltransferase [Selenomonas sp.]|uniref:serine acetyltransferase n=1 Tax=Selenomonas sp. AE3005 TaxID=1485543 RepID=UPI0004823853|nr:serine acetyltransferase [Selenomonas sp. AE3005]MBQ2087632.1 serine acetyltransferase [Selenomonas sp.]